jgi:hypothetical protein
MKYSTLSNKLTKLTLLPILVVISGCATSTTETVRTVNNYCLISEPIGYSSKGPSVETVDNKYDTDQTVGDVKKHNSRYECVCKDDCPIAENKALDTAK